MSIKREPSSDLLTGRRAIEQLKEVSLIEDLCWNENANTWLLQCSIAAPVEPGGFVPALTRWYVHIDDAYPCGDINFYPDKTESIKVTFQHQKYNASDNSEPWRTGCLCLDTGVKALGRHGYDYQPFSAEERLLWHFERAIDWLELASKNQLSTPGEPFEMPYFRYTSYDLVAFSEKERASIVVWDSREDDYGLVEFGRSKQRPYLYYVLKYKSVRGIDIAENQWGLNITKSMIHDRISGLWIKLKGIPVGEPWQVPDTWAELCSLLARQDCDIMSIIKANVKHFRDGNRHPLLLGFPVPEKIGEDLKIYFWQAILLPELSYGKYTAKGYRTKEDGYWQRDIRTFTMNLPVAWIKSQNWHISEILNRGRLPINLTHESYTLIGAGALGSAAAEMFVREGVTKMTIIDDDVFTAGNLARHTLTFDNIRQSKAEALAEHLNKVSIHAKAESIKSIFPPGSEEMQRLEDNKIIVDCTGEDDVLLHLSRIEWNKVKKYISLSIGFEAKRVFLFAYNGRRFPYNEYRTMIAPYLEKERIEFKGNELPRENIGCWHPIFPARADDIWLAASGAFKQIVKILNNVIDKPTLYVYEQQTDHGDFSGFKLVAKEISDV